jgi:soluble lytic murein transglycosylase-like protein
MKILFLTFLFTLLMTSPAHAETPVAGIAELTPYLSEIEPLQDIKDKIIIEEAITEYGAKYEVDADLIKAVIFCESEGKITAKNHNKNGTTDYGLMQINSCNHEWLKKELGITDFYDIKQNIHCGVFMIADLMSRHDNLHTVLMAYNMGERRTKELHREGIYTSKYSRKVMGVYEKLKEETK